MNLSNTRESIIKKRGYRQSIKGDKFSLYISNNPIVVDYLKRRIGNTNKVLAELCCGIGVTLEHIADGFKQIIGIDIDPKILSECKDNLEAVGLLPKSTLICGDVSNEEVLKRIKADLVIYDIPFWFPHEYINQEDLTKRNPPLKEIIEKIRKHITKDIIIFCSPKVDYQFINEELGICEFQKVFVNGKHDRNHIYLGRLIEKEGTTKIELKMSEL